MALFNAWRRRVWGVAAVWVGAELPNKRLASCSCNACWLNCTRSAGGACCSADCTLGKARAEEIDDDPVLDSNWDKSTIPGLTEVTALIKVHIGRNPELFKLFCGDARAQRAQSNRHLPGTIECSHMKLLPLGALCACLCLVPMLVTRKAVAQKAAPQPPKAAQGASESDDPTRIILDVTRVNILFTVTDKKGRFITDLTKGDFDIVENKKPQTIQQFTAESDLPLRLAVLVDTSNSIREQFRFEQQAAIRFIQSVLRPRADKVMLVSFDSAAEMVSDLTDDLKKLEDGVQSMRPGGGTAFYDAIYFAAKEKLMMDQPRDKFRRAMIVISDGMDTESRMSRDQALEMAQKADVVIYAISTNIKRDDSDGDKVLRYLTEETGGQAFFPFKIEDLDQSFENIANELRHQYNIFYRPEPLKTDGLYHPVTVTTTARKHLVVRARKGYYAPKL